jgi:hypothetical protein
MPRVQIWREAQYDQMTCCNFFAKILRQAKRGDTYFMGEWPLAELGLPPPVPPLVEWVAYYNDGFPTAYPVPPLDTPLHPRMMLIFILPQRKDLKEAGVVYRIIE